MVFFIRKFVSKSWKFRFLSKLSTFADFFCSRIPFGTFKNYKNFQNLIIKMFLQSVCSKFKRTAELKEFMLFVSELFLFDSF